MAGCLHVPLASLPDVHSPARCPACPAWPLLQVMRNTLYKAYLDDFSHFVHRVGGTTGQVMGELLSFEVGGWVGG